MRLLNAIKDLPQTSVLLMRDRKLFGSVCEENRICVPLDQVAVPVVRTLLATEDRRFFKHAGVDFRAIARATYVNFRAGRFIQGGSTITQQLARMAVLHRSDRTVRRKLLETVVAILIEWYFRKERILEAYLNAAYFGHNVYGVELAALNFCGKPAAVLDEMDAAYLIALLKAPARYCRCCNPTRAAGRTELVLRLAGASRARATEVIPPRKWENRSSFSDLLSLTGGYPRSCVQRWLRKTLPARYPAQRLVIHTTLDARCQAVLEVVCASVRRSGYSGKLACLIQDSRSGAIRALSGGIDFRQQEFNAASDGFLQPGSLLKPFVLLAALQSGVSLDHKYHSRPLTLRLSDGRFWSVRNAGDRYNGWISIADALVCSDNTVYAQLLVDVGLGRVVQLLKAVGLTVDVATPAIGTGAIRPGVSPLQMCSAYSVFSSGGTFIPSTIIERVADEDGNALWSHGAGSVNVCRPAEAFAVTTVLKRVADEGTGVLPFRHVGLAAKTGTSVSGGWYMSFDYLYRVLTWTEDEFLAEGISQYSEKAVSAKALASRVWTLLAKAKLGFSELYSVFAGVDSMSVRDLLWVEDQFQNT